MLVDFYYINTSHVFRFNTVKPRLLSGMTFPDFSLFLSMIREHFTTAQPLG